MGLYLKLDSRNKVYAFRYGCKDEKYHSCLNKLGAQLIDQSIEDLYLSFAQTIAQSTSEEFAPDLLLEQCLIRFNKAFAFLLGEERNSHLAKENIVCRCMGVDRAKLQDLYHAYKGNEKELILNSNIGLTCGECMPVFQAELKNLQDKAEYFFGLDSSEILPYFQDSLESFKAYSPLGEKIQGINEVKVEAQCIQMTLTLSEACNSETLASNLTNFFSARFEAPIQVVLTIL